MPSIPSQSTSPDRLVGVSDERALMARTGGSLWLLAGVVTLVGLLLPGTDLNHPRWALALGAYSVIYGLLAVTDLVAWSRAPVRAHQIATLTAAPGAAVLIWATGGSQSYALPVISLIVFFAAYFFDRRITSVVVILGLAALASPLAYDSRSVADGYLPLMLSLGASCLVLAGVTLWLKEKLVEAELVQRRMALQDPLTGLSNRRAFNSSLEREAQRRPAGPDPAGPASALLFLDLDDFKGVNDLFGHPAGDRVLCEIADGFAAVVRPGDTLARIGGDEFAVVAPRAGAEGAQRMAADLRAAAARVTPGADAAPMSVTVSVAVLSDDCPDAEGVMRVADRRLHRAKRRTAGGAGAPVLTG